MKKIHWQNLFKKKIKTNDLKSAGRGMVNYVRDWKIIVITFAIGLLVLSFFSWRVYLSNQIAGGYLSPEVDTTTAVTKTIDQKRLQDVIDILENKQIDFLNLKTNPQKLVDPSI